MVDKWMAATEQALVDGEIERLEQSLDLDVANLRDTETGVLSELDVRDASRVRDDLIRELTLAYYKQRLRVRLNEIELERQKLGLREQLVTLQALTKGLID